MAEVSSGFGAFDNEVRNQSLYCASQAMVIDKSSTEIVLKIRFLKDQVRLDFSILACSIMNGASHG
jgi:hypothetical protein